MAAGQQRPALRGQFADMHKKRSWKLVLIGKQIERRVTIEKLPIHVSVELSTNLSFTVAASLESEVFVGPV